MNDALREKIARALGAGLEDHERPVFAGRQLATTQAEAIADAVLAVIDLDKVRAEAQVEALEYLATAHYLDGPRSTYDTIMRRAKNIAREAGIETEDAGA